MTMLYESGEEDDLTAQPLVRVPLPPPGGYLAEHLDFMTDLPPHTELIDGGLVFVSPQKLFHTVTIDLLTNGLRRTCPAHLLVRREMSVVIGLRQRPEPDIVVIRAEAEISLDQTFYRSDAVVLAVEVESPDSEIRDRKRKPELYAEAEIPYFWRVANEEGKAVVHTYKLDPATQAYARTGIFLDRLRQTDPFEIDIDLTLVR
jgi:Uma2 family endonuclease